MLLYIFSFLKNKLFPQSNLLKYKHLKPYSQKGINWLKYRSQIDGVDIQHAENGGEFVIPTTKFKADGYAKLTNTIYEFHGCIFHGCPKCYDPNFINKINNKSMKFLYDKTKKKERTIKKLGYNYVIIWEHEWDLMCKKGLNKVTWTSYLFGMTKGLAYRIF